MRDFWRGRRVFLTGHTGFKGGWLALWLQDLGAELTGLALAPPTEPNLFTLARVASGMRSIDGDIEDLASLTVALRVARPSVVLHLAAQPLVRAGYAQPVETYRTNVMGTLHVLEAVRQAGGVQAVVNVTTDKCYENREWHWGYREADRLGGVDPYSNSKACSELVTQSYRSAFFATADYARHGVALASARAGNVIGGGDWGRDRLIPDMIRAIEAGEPVAIRRPQAIRPWQHVLEPLAGYLLLAQRLVEQGPEFARAWNFGPDEGDARPVQHVVETVVRLWGQGAAWRRDGAEHPHEAHYLKLDCSQARAELAWRPRLPLAEALAWTVDWHRRRLAGENLRAVCQAQLHEYRQRMNA